ncbi:unnamed protein product, partial [Didymodactylos carnosus]
HIYDCLIYIKDGDKYSADDQEITDFNVIVEVVNLCGGKQRLVPNPFPKKDLKREAIKPAEFVRT